MGLLHEDVGFMQQPFCVETYFCVSPNFPFNPFQWGIREWKERDRGMIVHFFAWKAVDFMPADHVNLMIRGFSVAP